MFSNAFSTFENALKWKNGTTLFLLSLVFPNRVTNVLRADLKDERDVVFLTESGRLFHNIGAEKEKARSPYVTELTVGTVKSSLEDERRLCCGWCCCTRDHK